MLLAVVELLLPAAGAVAGSLLSGAHLAEFFLLGLAVSFLLGYLFRHVVPDAPLDAAS